MDVKLEATWKARLAPEFKKPYFEELTTFVRSEYLSQTVFPPPKQLFAAFDAAPFEQVRVVILGQDPYHGPGQANGLCFSVGEHVPLPPSLKNIYKELAADLQCTAPTSGDLRGWAKQGVLLLNATLTVRAHQAGSHQQHGWETFTDAAIHALAQEREGLVFILWGRHAQQKGQFIDRQRHLVLTSAHPSPLSAHNGFFGSRPFSQTNAYLLAHGQQAINWTRTT